MPRGDTDIPHVAFTHHRIGLHKKDQHTESARVPELVPTDDVSHLSPLDQKRGLGLAYLEAFRNPVNSRHAGVFADRVRELLESVRAEGLRDPESAEALAHVCWEKKDVDRAREYAQEALRATDLSPDGRAIALVVLAFCEIQDHNPPAAIGPLEELGRMRRYADDWRMLGKCYLEEGQPIKAISALEQALAIRPYRPSIHLDLAEAYRLLGNTARAGDHVGRARWLFNHKQD
jgi:tetratricopeptide (TPR) repeat protein